MNYFPWVPVWGSGIVQTKLRQTRTSCNSLYLLFFTAIANPAFWPFSLPLNSSSRGEITDEPQSYMAGTEWNDCTKPDCCLVSPSYSPGLLRICLPFCFLSTECRVVLLLPFQNQQAIERTRMQSWGDAKTEEVESQTFPMPSFAGQFCKCPATWRPQTVSSSIRCYSWSTDSGRNWTLSSKAREPGDLTCHLPHLLGKRACMHSSILYVANDSESSLSNFLLVTWIDCGRRWFKKSKSCTKIFWFEGKKEQPTPLATNELLSASIRHDINIIIACTDQKTTGTQSRQWWGMLPGLPGRAKGAEGQVYAVESVGSGIRLPFSHLPAGDKGGLT